MPDDHGGVRRASLGSLDDPRRRPYVVFWPRECTGIPYALKMEPSDSKDAVLVTIPDGQTFQVPVVYRPLPRGAGRALFYQCPGCRRLRRYLYPFALVGDRVVSYVGLRCQPCAGFRFASQGLYRRQSERTLGPYPRFPRDPRAVSDPRLLAEEAGTDPSTLMETGKLKLMTGTDELEELR